MEFCPYNINEGYFENSEHFISDVIHSDVNDWLHFILIQPIPLEGDQFHYFHIQGLQGYEVAQKTDSATAA